MPEYVYQRHVRTSHSEGYEFREGDTRIGHIDLHYGASEVYATLILERELDEDGLLAMIEQIDDDLVLSAETPRQDFLVSVYQGRDMGLYTDEFLRERVRAQAEGTSMTETGRA